MPTDNVTSGGSDPQSTTELSLNEGLLHDIKYWEQSDPLTSSATRFFLQRVLKCYMSQPISFVGIPGNILCCLVFFKQGLSDRINLLLFWLAVADLGNLVCQLLRMHSCYVVDPIQINNWNVVNIIYTGPINWWTGFTSGMLVLLLSVDRCLSVVAPFKAKRLLKFRFTVAAIVVSYVLPFTFTSFNFMAFSIQWRTDPVTNRSVAYMHSTPWFPIDHKTAFDLAGYFSVITRPVFLVIMVGVCSLTVIHLRRASETRTEIGANVTQKARSGEYRITIMLLVICCMYLVFIIPEIVYSILVTIIPDYNILKKYHNTAVVHYQFVFVASCLNSAINFVPYLLLSSRFKKTLQGTFSCFKSRYISE